MEYEHKVSVPCTAGGEHCWDNAGSITYNTGAGDSETVDIQTQMCRHCPARRERKTVTRMTYAVTEDSGWTQA